MEKFVFKHVHEFDVIRKKKEVIYWGVSGCGEGCDGERLKMSSPGSNFVFKFIRICIKI